MGRCKQADHCSSPAWCKTTGKCLKAEPMLKPCPQPHAAGEAHYRRLYEEAEAENCMLRESAEYAAHKLEGARIWNGTEWHYNPLHPLHYRSALERLRQALKA
jgi:hypothetical protein